jgi:CHAD domain-containing protein
MPLDADEIEKPARKVRKLVTKIGSQPTPDDIHKFRTNCRRLETSLDVLAIDATGAGRRTSKHVAKLRKRAGKIRDIDVLTRYVAGIKLVNSERDCQARLLEHLGARRETCVKGFEALRKRYRGQLRRDLKRISKKLKKDATRPGASRKHLASTDVAARALTKISDLRDPPRLQRSNLHAYRLKVKELRNLLQMAAGAEQQHFIDKLGDVKDAIGEWHDWEVLVVQAKDVLEHGNTCRLVKELSQTANRKYKSAVSLTQRMRREFLHLPAHSPKSSKGRALRLTQPVLSATAALVA